MANRIPLIVDTTDGNKIKELPGGDSLDLTSSAIINATSITTTGTLTAQQVNVNGSNLAAVATTGNYDDLNNTPLLFDGNYLNLSNKPTIPTRVFELFDVSATNPDDGDILRWNNINTQWESQSLSSTVDLSDKTINELQNVIITGSADDKFLKFYAGAWRPANVTYAEVQNAPTALSELINDAGFITSETDSQTLSYDGVTLTISNGNSVTIDSITGELNGNVNSNDGNSVILDVDSRTLFGSLRGDVVGNVTGNVTGDVVGSIFADDSTTMVDAVNNVLTADNVNAVTFFGESLTVTTDVNAVGFQGNVFGNGGQNVPLQILSGQNTQSGNSILINPYGSDTIVQTKAETHIWDTGEYSSTGNPYMRFTTVGAIEAKDGAYFEGNLVGDVIGSIYADDSSVMIDGTENKIVGDVDSSNVTGTNITGTDIVGTTIKGSLRAVNRGPTPITDALADGALGEIRFDNTYMYIKCPDGDWRRIALSIIP